MRILDENNKELSEYDETKGYVTPEEIVTKHHDAVEATPGKGLTYRTIKEYPNGGKDVEEVWEVPPQPARAAFDETEQILRYHPYSDEQLAQNIRTKRDQLLTDCDWTMLPDNQLTEEQRQAWREYRQALRDIPEQEDFPENVEYPTAPTN